LIMCGLLYLGMPTIRLVAKETGQSPKNPKNIDMLVPAVALVFLIVQIFIVCLILINI